MLNKYKNTNSNRYGIDRFRLEVVRIYEPTSASIAYIYMHRQTIQARNEYNRVWLGRTHLICHYWQWGCHIWPVRILIKQFSKKKHNGLDLRSIGKVTQKCEKAKRAFSSWASQDWNWKYYWNHYRIVIEVCAKVRFLSLSWLGARRGSKMQSMIRYFFDGK